MEAIYEHHLKLRMDRLCPFKLLNGKQGGAGVANFHDNIEVFFVKGGRGIIQCGPDELVCSEGDTVVISSGEIHRVCSIENFKYVGIIIDDGFCRDNGIEMRNFRFLPHFCDGETASLICSAADAIAEYRNYEEPLKAARVRSAVLSLIINLVSNHCIAEQRESNSSEISKSHVKRALSYLDANFKEHISLDSLAAQVGITKYHLVRLFKIHTGETVTDHLNTKRCNEAKRYLERGMTVTEAAIECGFESVSYFSRVYKRVMGASPSVIKNK